jgi:hypothetical protein
VFEQVFNFNVLDYANVPILSNGIGGKSLYGWTDKAKINQPSLTISARGTIGWTSFRDTPFFPIVRLHYRKPISATHTRTKTHHKHRGICCLLSLVKTCLIHYSIILNLTTK